MLQQSKNIKRFNFRFSSLVGKMSDIETVSKFANECPIRMKWRVKEEDLKDAFERKDFLSSEKFHASKLPGVRYYLYLFGKDLSKLFIFLKLNFKMIRTIKAKWTIHIKSASYKSELEDEFEYDGFKSHGITPCKPDEIFDPEKKFFVDGIMEIELEGTLKTQGIKRKAPKPLSLAQLLYEKEDDKDITIVVKDKQIKVHKMLLCSKSPVFKAELESGLKESQENKITITDFDFETIQLCIHHLYENDIEDLFDEEDAYDILRFADKYDIHSLHDLIQEIMVKELSEDNVVEFSNASVTFNAAELKEYCICFLMTFVGNTTIIKNANKLKNEILQELGRRSLFSSSQ